MGGYLGIGPVPDLVAMLLLGIGILFMVVYERIRMSK